jgi:hypothetical protein
MTTSTQKYRYAVLGEGRQGTAAAYDMALCGQAHSVVSDYDLAVAQTAPAGSTGC